MRSPFLSLPASTDSLLTDSMDVLVDLSRVHFLCTANNLDANPLPNRMEVLEACGYVFQEAVISWRYLES